MLSKEGCFEQDFSGLFEGALSKWSTVHTVDTVASDRSKDASLSHYVDQSAQMPVVNIDSICAQNHAQLLDETEPCSFNTKHLQDLDGMVTRGSSRIDSLYGEYSRKVDTICLDEIAIFDIFDGSSVLVKGSSDTRLCTTSCKDLRDSLEASQRNLIKDLIGHFTKKHDHFLTLFVTEVVWSYTHHVSSL